MFKHILIYQFRLIWSINCYFGQIDKDFSLKNQYFSSFFCNLSIISPNLMKMKKMSYYCLKYTSMYIFVEFGTEKYITFNFTLILNWGKTRYIFRQLMEDLGGSRISTQNAKSYKSLNIEWNELKFYMQLHKYVYY